MNWCLGKNREQYSFPTIQMIWMRFLRKTLREMGWLLMMTTI